ncbi:MAG: hypothetical protein WAX07_10135, partial [Candidatus Altiarchaeia archaeon]
YIYAGIDKIKYSGDYPSVEDTIIHLILDNAANAMEYAKWLLIMHKDGIDTNRLKKDRKNARALETNRRPAIRPKTSAGDNRARQTINNEDKAAGTKWNFHKYSPGMIGGHCIQG